MDRSAKQKQQRRERHLANQRRFQAHEDQLKALRRHLDLTAEALCHDYQFDVREACRILEILALPKRLTRAGQFYELCKLLGLKRDAQGWGRPWSEDQLRRTFYAKGREFMRSVPKPVTKAETEAWVGPVTPPGAVHGKKTAAGG